MSRFELNIDTDYSSAKRFPAWVSLTVFSAVCLAGVQSQWPTTVTAAHRWSLACTILSLLFSIFSVCFYLFARHLFIATPLEIGTGGLLLIFWIAGFSVMMDPSRGIAVDTVAVINANLYFGSWAALASLIYIGGSLAQDVTGIGARDLAPVKMARWYGISFASVIVWVSAVRFFNARACSNPYLTHTERCKRTKFAIAMGVITFIASLVMGYALRFGLGLLLEFGVTSLLFVLWCFGVGFITFGQSPGALIGNLYFASWICFILITMLFSDSFKEFLDTVNRVEGDESQAKDSENGGAGDDDLQLRETRSPQNGSRDEDL